jgi:hypothetical protein
MAWKLGEPAKIFQEFCKILYDSIKDDELPESAGGTWGIDQDVADKLNILAYTKMKELKFPLPPGDYPEGVWLKGMCIYSSTVAKRFLFHRKSYESARVVKMDADTSDHYFVVIWQSEGKGLTGIVDITCKQFSDQLTFIADGLDQAKGKVSGVKASNLDLSLAYTKALNSTKEIYKENKCLI